MYQLNKSGIGSEQHHQDLRNSQDERVTRRLSVARPERSVATDRSGTRRLRVVTAPGGFAFVED